MANPFPRGLGKATNRARTSELLVHELIERAGARNPDEPALRHGAKSLSHRDLTYRAKQLAGYLLDRGVAPGSVVAVRLDRSFEQIIACLAILHAGSAFMPIDPAVPPERAKQLVDAGDAAAIITDQSRAGEHQGIVIILDDDAGRAAIEAFPLRSLPIVAANDLAYIIHTSGSTGVPNGVEIEHGSLRHLIHWTTTTFDITARDRTSHAHGLGFDAVIWELWPALAAGATVHIIDDVVRTSPPLLQAALLEQRITIAFVPTVLAEALIAADWPADTPLRFVLTGGDVLRAWPRKPLPFALVNNYGPAECTVQTTWTVVPMRGPETADDLPTIGRPIEGVQVHILDEQQQPVADGVEGELWIAGKSVGRGYRNRPELTARKFCPDPFSGEPNARMYRTGDRGCRLANGKIVFRGRADSQVKIDGIRIELDEIAVTLQRHAAVESVLVRALDLLDGSKALTAYVVARAGARPTPADFRWFLYQRLPRNYIPRFFVLLDALPLTRNGKVDLAALPPPAPERASRSDRAGGRTALETSLLAIVGEVLDLPDVSLADNFFLLGGHSMLAAAALVRCREAFDVQMSLRDFFDARTIGNFASLLQERRGEAVIPVPECHS
ncbi:MAG: non-ribosomal peptide synthetase [Sphingomonas sp.]